MPNCGLPNEVPGSANCTRLNRLKNSVRNSLRATQDDCTAGEGLPQEGGGEPQGGRAETESKVTEVLCDQQQQIIPVWVEFRGCY
jgi:hypothetical protein